MVRADVFVCRLLKAALIHDCSPIPVFFFLYSKILDGLHFLALLVVVTIDVANYKPKFTLETGFPLPNVRSKFHWELYSKRSEGIHAEHFADTSVSPTDSTSEGINQKLIIKESLRTYGFAVPSLRMYDLTVPHLVRSTSCWAFPLKPLIVN